MNLYVAIVDVYKGDSKIFIPKGEHVKLIEAHDPNVIVNHEEVLKHISASVFTACFRNVL
jgi:hypothetical protein